MNDRLLSSFRAFLVGWCFLVLAHFVYVQAKTDWGSKDLAWDPGNLWHPIYFGVVNATFVIIPFVAFQIPVALRYGGWSSAVGRSILALGIGTSLWGLGNFYWFVQNARGVEAPYPSLADAGYLAVLPFAAWALWELSKVVGIVGRDWLWLVGGLLVAMPLNLYIMLPTSLLGRFLPDSLLRWAVEAGTFDTPLAAIISTTYIISDVVLLAMGIVVALGARRAAGGRFFTPVLAVTASIALLYVGDLFFNYRIANDIFYNAEISDLLYGAFIIVTSFSVYLFLAADVRAKAAVAEADEQWEPELAASVASSGPTLAPLDALATAILRGQERVMGQQTARGIAQSVPGITIDETADIATATNAAAIDALVREYRALAGPLGEMACWTAARPVFTRHPDLRVPSLERFRTEGGSSADAARATAITAG